MNILDNEMVLEYLEGTIRFRNIQAAQDRCFIRYTGANPNGSLSSPTGSVAFGPSGSWENVSLVSPGTTWQVIGTDVATADGFLAPNEFYVDTTSVPGPTGREVTTINAAIALADTLFPAGIAIVIRLREGQNHTWAQSNVATTRDIAILAEGQVTGEGVDETVAGRVIYGGSGVKLGHSATRRRLEIRNLAVQGTLKVGSGWDLVCSEVTFTGSRLEVDQNGGAGLDIGITLDRCVDDGNSAVDTVKSFQIATTNHAPAGVNPTRFLLDGCQFHPVISVVEKTALLAAGNSVVMVRRNSIYARVDLGGAGQPGLFDAPTAGTTMKFVDTSYVLDSPNDDAKLLSSAPGMTVKFLGSSKINVITPLGFATKNWSIGLAAGVSGSLLVENEQPPSLPFAGLVMSDANLLFGPTISGIRGPITKRVFTLRGLAFTGGRKVYGSAVGTKPIVAPDGDATWFTPTATPAVVPSAPTAIAIPLPNATRTLIRWRAVARSVPPGFAGSFDATTIVEKVLGVATIVSGAGPIASVPGGATINPAIDANNEFTLRINDFLGPAGTQLQIVYEATVLGI